MPSGSTIITSICDECAGVNDREGLTAWSVPTSQIADITRAMIADSPVEALIRTGVMVVDDSGELVFGKKYQYHLRGRVVEANTGNNGTGASSAQNCLYPSVTIAESTYTRAAHTHAINASVEKCLNALRQTENYRQFSDANSVLSPSAFYAYMRKMVMDDVQKRIGTSILFGQRNASVTGDSGGALFDGILKKAKLAAANSYYHTLQFDFSNDTKFTLFGFGNPLQFSNRADLAEYLATRQLAGAGLSGLAYSVLLVGSTLTVTSNVADLPINGNFRIFGGVVQSDCDTDKLITPVTVQNYSPLDAAPLITAWEAITVENAASALYAFVQKVITYSIQNGKGWGTPTKKIVIFYDPYFDLQNNFRLAVRECCANVTGMTFDQFMAAHNIAFEPLTALYGTSLFLASTLDNMRFNRASALDTMGFRETCEQTWKAYYGTFAGLSIINTGDIAISCGGYPLYDMMTNTTDDVPEANLALCPAVQTNCIGTTTAAYHASATAQSVLCNGEQYVHVLDTTTYPNTRNGATVNIGYLDGNGDAQVLTINLGAMELNAVATLAATDTITLVEVIASDSVLGNIPTFIPAHNVVSGDCDDLELACLTHKPSSGDGSGDTAAIVAAYASQGVVNATWVAYDSGANEATYTLQYLGDTLPVAAGSEAIVAGACV